MSKQNPLSGHFRTTKFHITLPSNPNMYPDGTIDYTEDGEVGIMGMTSRDEMGIKNPDALLNGEAILDLLKSCVPAIRNPKKLIANDIDACLLAIRHASYGDDLDIIVNCPGCEKENSFSLNITQSLATIIPLNDEYFLETNNGIRIYVKPMDFPLLVKTLRQHFEQEKIMNATQNTALTDDARMSLFSKTVKNISDMTQEIILGCIAKILIIDDGTEVTDKDHIKEFIGNIEKDVIESINNLLKEINSSGVKKTMDAKCQHCDHEWEASIDFNPLTFFSQS